MPAPPTPIYQGPQHRPPATGRTVAENAAAMFAASPPPEATSPAGADLDWHRRHGASHWQIVSAPLPKSQSYTSFVEESRWLADPGNHADTLKYADMRRENPSEFNRRRGVGDWSYSQILPWDPLAP